jgi:sec-independent protein translocase protein TatB
VPNGGEFLLLLVLALVILGPDKLPQYAAKLAQFVRSARDMAEGAKSQIKDELGPGFEDVDWRSLDPRQYDPRRIVREALATPRAGARQGRDAAGAAADSAGARELNEAAIEGRDGQRNAARRAAFDPVAPTPWDTDAT